MLGCRLNQSEIETMARQFQQQGHEIVDDPALADQIVVNTCAVTQDCRPRQPQTGAPTAPRQRAGGDHGHGLLCPDRACRDRRAARCRAGDRQPSKDALVPALTGQPLEPFDAEPIARDTPQHLARTRAFVKVQDGCDNACTFCVTTIARGAGRSRTLDDVVREIKLLHALGCQEAVLTGVHLGSYGHDFGNREG